MDDPTLSQKHPLLGPRKALKEFGDYEIECELGRGGMGIVYLAKKKNLNRRVALKMLTGHYGPDELRRFLEEAETAAGLSHTNITHIYEVGEHEGAPFFSMEYVDGGTLGFSRTGFARKVVLDVSRCGFAARYEAGLAPPEAN